jgi:ribosomal protein S18 acetylase RimI-like enzyme
MDVDKLDNPVWHSLNEMHGEFSLSFNNLKCYKVDYCPFGAYMAGPGVSAGIVEYSKLTSNFFIVGNQPDLPPEVILKKELVCLQMVVEQIPSFETREQILKLDDQYATELFDLVNLVQPGYFRSKTRQLGSYFGIFKDGILVSVTGERMKMDQFTEVSAVVTHPDHGGKGYAKQLVAYVVNKILDEGKFPYLHVADTNEGAISLYKKLGFKTRRQISFWNVERRQDV